MSILGRSKGRSVSRIQFESILKRFIVFLRQQLQFTHDIPIILVDDIEFAKRIQAFGEISNKNIIHISIINRHPMDILRTVAHEYVHYKQHLEVGIAYISSHSGSVSENQANAKSGELLRKYGQRHPELFELRPIT